MKCALFHAFPTQTAYMLRQYYADENTLSYSFIYASVQGYHIYTAFQLPKFLYERKPSMNNSSTHGF
jgi:hypothetical protein